MHGRQGADDRSPVIITPLFARERAQPHTLDERRTLWIQRPHLLVDFRVVQRFGLPFAATRESQTLGHSLGVRPDICLFLLAHANGLQSWPAASG
jgi:hypothetical protein